MKTPANQPSRMLNTGDSIPQLGIGVFKVDDDECERVVSEALEVGYRHIDTAQMYENEETVGAALDAHDVPRDEVFLTTKIWHNRLQHDDLLQSLQESVNRLRVDAVALAAAAGEGPVERVPRRWLMDTVCPFDFTSRSNLPFDDHDYRPCEQTP